MFLSKYSDWLTLRQQVGSSSLPIHIVLSHTPPQLASPSSGGCINFREMIGEETGNEMFVQACADQFSVQ